MTVLDLTLPLGLGLVSSLHCAQMCGPIVLCVGQTSRPVRDHLAYNAGRILTYSALGALAGTAGHGIIRMAGIEQTAAILAGCIMVLAGLVMAGAAPRRVLVQVQRFGIPQLFSRTVGRLLVTPGAGRRLALGAMMGFLPCGLLYAALLKAVATGAAGLGALSMLLFGMGTAGALLAIGAFSSTIRLRLGRWSTALTAISITAMGALLVWRGIAATIPGMACHAGM